MTKLPVDSWNVKGIPGPEYQLNDFCPVPGCPRAGEERHHIFRRSFLIGDFWWCELNDGTVVGNCISLCHQHHREVTDNTSRIEYEEGEFRWNNLISAPRPLSWQPPLKNVPLANATSSLQDVTFEIVLDEVNQDHDSETHPKNLCPTCKRKLPKPKIESPVEEKRVRKTWACAVPMDARENGADTLDALLESARLELADIGMEYGEEGTAKFFVLSHVLGLFNLNAKQILS